MDTKYDLTKEADVVAYMSDASGEDDWSTRTDNVRMVNGGYPAFWYGAIIASGLKDKVFAKLGGGQLRIIKIEKGE